MSRNGGPGKPQTNFFTPKTKHMKNYISQLNGREQNAVHCIKKLVANQLQALIIYCFGCETTVRTSRSAFVKRQLTEERQFSCHLLIITPDELVIEEERKNEVQEMIAHFGKVNMTIHPLGFVLQQLNAGNLFFSWVHKNGMLLYNRNNSLLLLPPPVGGEYRPQVEAFYANDPEMAGYLEVNLQPLVKPGPKPDKPHPQPVEIRLMLDPQQGWQPAVTNAAVANSSVPHH